MAAFYKLNNILKAFVRKYYESLVKVAGAQQQLIRKNDNMNLIVHTLLQRTYIIPHNKTQISHKGVNECIQKLESKRQNMAVLTLVSLLLIMCLMTTKLSKLNYFRKLL